MTAAREILAHHALLTAIPVFVPVVVLGAVFAVIVVVDRRRARDDDSDE